MKVTDWMIKVFTEGKAAGGMGTGTAGPGPGIQAVLDMPEMQALERFARAAAALAVTDGTDEWNGMIDVWNALPQDVADMLLEPR